MKLGWSLWAQQDRDAIFDYIEADNPRAAAAVDQQIRDRVAVLLRFPLTGRPGRVDGTRELIISRTPYIVAYRIIGDTNQVLRVLHGSQRWPDELAPRESLGVPSSGLPRRGASPVSG